MYHLFQILSKSVKGFPSCEGPKMGVFHWLWPSPLQQVSTTVLPVIRRQKISHYRRTTVVYMANRHVHIVYYHSR